MDPKSLISKDTLFLASLVDPLKEIEGIVAVVLGGSRAKGTHHSGSDWDIGLYYDPNCPPELSQLQKWAKYLDDRKVDNLLTPFGEWGPWINGGGWLKVKSVSVDILYRDIEKVKTTIKESLEGQIAISYQPGHPHGFVNSIYLAEVAICQILFDKNNTLSGLKNQTVQYPNALKMGITSKFLWEADFALNSAKKGLPYYDVAYIIGCFFRAISCLNQVLFALNGQYWMNEKGAVRAITDFKNAPAQYEKKVNRIFSRLEPSRKHLNNSVKLLSELIQEVTALTTDETLVHTFPPQKRS